MPCTEATLGTRVSWYGGGKYLIPGLVSEEKRRDSEGGVLGKGGSCDQKVK